MRQLLYNIYLFLAVTSVACRSHTVITEVTKPATGTVYSISVNGKLENLVTRKPIRNSEVKLAGFTKYFYTKTDDNGNFSFKIVDNDSVSKNNPSIFNQSTYSVGWSWSVVGYRQFYDSINFPSSAKIISRTKTTYLVPFNIDSLVIGFTLEQFLDTISYTTFKESYEFSKSGWAIVQVEIQNDLFLQVYCKYDTVKYKFNDFELQAQKSETFMQELYQQKIVGTGRLIYGVPNSTRYINVEDGRKPIITGRVE